MNTALIIAVFALASLVFFLGFLVLGTLRALGLLTWRVEQLETVTPSRIGRDGLKLGKKAPDFTLPSAVDGEASLHDFAGRKVLLVFTQAGCEPCRDIIPELNSVQDKGEQQVLVVNNGDLESTRTWADDVQARFPVLAQEKFSLSKRYQVFATPFAFLIDERGFVASKGIVGSRQYLHYVLSGAGQRPQHDREEPESEAAETSEAFQTVSSTSTKELIHA
jgi:methylamine dehydrogenase accessory protein MauD